VSPKPAEGALLTGRFVAPIRPNGARQDPCPEWTCYEVAGSGDGSREVHATPQTCSTFHVGQYGMPYDAVQVIQPGEADETGTDSHHCQGGHETVCVR